MIISLRIHCIWLPLLGFRRGYGRFGPIYLYWRHVVFVYSKINVMIYYWAVKVYIIINVGDGLFTTRVLKLHDERQCLRQQKLLNRLRRRLSLHR
jgi:hypothetical protein